MAKDAKGHGSEAHGAAADPYQRAADMRRIKRMNMSGSNSRARLAVEQGRGLPSSDAEARATLAQGNPKADAAPVHPGAAGRQYYGSVLRGNSLKRTGPHPDRITARDAARAIAPKNAKFVSTGYGYNGSFDIRAHQHYEK